jgi:hypothetical protein
MSGNFIEICENMSTSDGWPVKAMSTEYLQFPWPYGARELIAERAKVQKVLQLSAQMTHGWFPGGHYEPVFKFPMSFQEGFVRCDAQRITLMDRVRTHYNFNWKRDVSQNAHARTPSEGSTPYDRQYAKLIEILLELQALTEELKPETMLLMEMCKSAHELQQTMLNARGIKE